MKEMLGWVRMIRRAGEHAREMQEEQELKAE